MVLQGSGRGEEATKKPLAKAPASQAIFRRPEGMRSLLQVRRGSKAQARASTPSPPQPLSEHSLTLYPGSCCICTAHEAGLEAQPRRCRGAGKLGSRSRFIAQAAAALLHLHPPAQTLTLRAASSSPKAALLSGGAGYLKLLRPTPQVSALCRACLCSRAGACAKNAAATAHAPAHLTP